MSVLKVSAIKNNSSTSNNLILNTNGTVSVGGGGTVPSNTYIQSYTTAISVALG